ncbi:MAG: aminotransferase class IV [Dehalococcoidia bacterium]|nr:aminotransferase class IV [Dehalococcoidia bacterium]
MSEAVVWAFDRGLLHGYGLFETMRSYGGRVFRLEQHYRRLTEGASTIRLELPLSLEELRSAIDALLERNVLPDARIRLTVTAGPVPEAGEARPTIMLFATPLTDYPPELYERGMSAVTSAIRRNEMSPLSGVKSLNYLDNLLAREEALRRGADHAILLNTRGLVAEGSSSNVFVVDGETLLTPDLASGALPGITRAVVIEIAPQAGLAVRETRMAPETLSGAEEAFLTGSVMGVMPLTRLDGAPIGSGRPGPKTALLRRLYSDLVERETAQ